MALADAVERVPGVGLRGPSGIEIATQFAGGRVVGIQMTAEAVSVHIVSSRVPLGPVVDEVRAAARRVLTAAGDHRPVAVTVEDVDLDAIMGGSS
jgi:hypothetical protein